jgi:DNA-binding transcriptional regulator YiaG
MASKTAFDASRISAFGFDPDDLVLIKDPKHPLYDARIRLPLKPEFVANIKALGVMVPVVVRKIDGAPVVIDGRQRVRAALEANRQRKAEGLPPMKIPAVERKGSAGDAYAVTISTNEHRQEDALRAKIEKAQRSHQLGNSEEDIATQFGVSVATVKRWLDANPKERGPRKPRGKATRPSAKRVALLVKAMQAVADVPGTGPIRSGLVLLRWREGLADDAELFKAWPEFAAPLSQKEKKEIFAA